jgi:cytochrome P450
LPDKDIIVEITNLIFAGTDTTGNTFSYMFFELARHPEWQEKLHQELDKVDFIGVPAHSNVSQLPILDALIHETLRVWPASPASLPRVTPIGGGIIDGVRVPENVSHTKLILYRGLILHPQAIVSIQAYTTQRDPIYFPRPDEFLPERWLDSELRTDLVAMRDMILVWGKGQRACMGKPIAMMELRVTTAALMKRFVVELESEATVDDMEMRDHFVLMAKGGKCMLKFWER